MVEERGGEEVVVVAGGRITAGKPTHPFTHTNLGQFGVRNRIVEDSIPNYNEIRFD